MASNFTHYIIMIIVFPIFCFILLCMALLALRCYLKKKEKKTTMVEEIEVKHVDKHMRVKENIVKGSHGEAESVVVSVEGDCHVDDDIVTKKKELKAKISAETTPSALEAGHSY
ncbi:hypothetical protein EJD97_017943 [Solanum chilense]|uniref:Uncharacterized protein n=1 Tax=Solanum chilense TaxID=4083 RepID=A0A6N2B6Q6_SOLCI|nr:hypothetical protein EJD97_017943 [Solanum chilense]